MKNCACLLGLGVYSHTSPSLPHWTHVGGAEPRRGPESRCTDQTTTHDSRPPDRPTEVPQKIPAARSSTVCVSICQQRPTESWARMDAVSRHATYLHSAHCTLVDCGLPALVDCDPPSTGPHRLPPARLMIVSNGPARGYVREQMNAPGQAGQDTGSQCKIGSGHTKRKDEGMQS